MKRATKNKIKAQLPFSVFISILFLNRWALTRYSYVKFCSVLGNIMLFELFNKLKFVETVSELSWTKGSEFGEKHLLPVSLKITWNLYCFWNQGQLWKNLHCGLQTTAVLRLSPLFPYQFKIQVMFSRWLLRFTHMEHVCKLYSIFTVFRCITAASYILLFDWFVRRKKTQGLR